MKKIFTLIAAALLAVGVNAQKLTLGGQAENGSWSWGWTQQFGAEADLSFGSQWGEFNLATDLTDAVSFKLVVAEANALINLRVNNKVEDNNRFIAVDATEITGPVNEDDTKIELQATEAAQDLHVLSFVLIDAAGKETQTTYSQAWGVASYGGKYTTSQWAELYLIGAAADEAQTINLTFNEAVPEGALQLKVYYADGTETYPEIPAGTSASIEIPAAVAAISLQAKDVYTIDVKSAERVLASGINGVAATKTVKNGAIYNLAGQKVSSNYKGIVIQNGKKFVQK